MESLFCYTGLEKCTSAKPGKRDCFLPKQCRFEDHNIDFETPKFQPKTPSESGPTSALNRGTQQGFKVLTDLNPLCWKSAQVQNQPNAIVSN